jgi:DNA gyrase subunit A
MAEVPFARELVTVPLERELATSYTRYAMSVIVSRALPDVRDGLKPVQRRILYAMYEQNMFPDRPREKCAAVVGEVMKKYHPHGDAPIYEALVRMAQDFTMRYPLIDGQGNFGSIDGDPPAQMRYTECRLAPIAMAMLEDIDKETVDWRPNYDEKHMEPVVLPAKVPNLLINGATGIAVAMATEIPPHNLGEVVDALLHLIDHPDASIDDLMKFLPGPDFPTGGIIVGKDGIREAYTTGRGTIVLQGRATIENLPGGRTAIVITELPYRVSKEQLIVQIANLVQSRKLEGVADVNDETDRTGMRIVVEVKRDYNPRAVLAQLYKLTNLRVNYGIILLALVNNEPKILTLKDLLQHYIDHRRQVVTRRTQFELRRAEARAHILEGLRLVARNLDEVIAIIRRSESREEAKERLMRHFKLSEQQADAILNMQLGQLTRLDQQRLREEYEALIKRIEELQAILRSPKQVDFIIKQELQEVKRQFADSRRTAIVAQAEDADVPMEELLAEQDIAIAISRDGYIKRLPLDAYLERKRGKTTIGLSRKEQDALADLVIASTRHTLLFFSNKGRCYQLRAYEIPSASREAKGMHLGQLLQLDADEQIVSVVPIATFDDGGFLFMATRNGTVKKTPLSEFTTRLAKGVQAITCRKAMSCAASSGRMATRKSCWRRQREWSFASRKMRCARWDDKRKAFGASTCKRATDWSPLTS